MRVLVAEVFHLFGDAVDHSLLAPRCGIDGDELPQETEQPAVGKVAAQRRRGILMQHLAPGAARAVPAGRLTGREAAYPSRLRSTCGRRTASPDAGDGAAFDRRRTTRPARRCK